MELYKKSIKICHIGKNTLNFLLNPTLLYYISRLNKYQIFKIYAKTNV